MKIQNIEEGDFSQIEGPRQVIVHDHARRFAAIDLGNNLGRYGISWRSDLVEPTVTLSSDASIAWIGVDQQLAAIRLHKGRICVCLALDANILQILAINNMAAVLTETEVLLFNPDCSIRLIQDLPELAEEMSFSDTTLVVRLLEGNSVSLNLQ
ncbi:MAG: hypothetical protein RBJ76_05070 [Stenomitos frigidus ULC029]